MRNPSSSAHTWLECGGDATIPLVARIYNSKISQLTQQKKTAEEALAELVTSARI